MTAPRPVLTVRPPALFLWEQHRPGGCRCVCAIYHRRRVVPVPAAACLAAAEPGLLIRVDADGQTSDPKPVCARCYTALSENDPVSDTHAPH